MPKPSTGIIADAYGLTWGVISPQAMVWAEAAGRHDHRKTLCEL